MYNERKKSYTDNTVFEVKGGHIDLNNIKKNDQKMLDAKAPCNPNPYATVGDVIEHRATVNDY